VLLDKYQLSIPIASYHFCPYSYPVPYGSRSSDPQKQATHRSAIFAGSSFLGYHLKTRSAICFDPSPPNLWVSFFGASRRPVFVGKSRALEQKCHLVTFAQANAIARSQSVPIPLG
jgi:hypothetical protein